MGQAVDIVKNIMKNKDNYEELGLIFPEYAREWKEFNMLVGENGSGKTRMLQMIKDNIPEKCIIFYLDFANYIHPIRRAGENSLNTDENPLVDGLVLRANVDKGLFLDFLSKLDTQILHMFNELLRMKNDENERIRKHAQNILNDLNPSVKDILHREIKIEEDGIYLCKDQREVTIENEWKLLSPGEWSILLVIFAILFIRLEKKPCILLIDELETHLHPEAQIKLYELLKNGLKESEADHCTCIASHSIFLLPHFDVQELVYMNNGQIEKINGGIYQQIYDNLTGESNKKKESLTDFLFSMSAWQYAEFLAECFLDPQTVDTAQSTDKQALQFVEVFKKLCEEKEKVNVLDFGAGSGRIGKCIELMLKDNEDVFARIHQLKYNIYDKYSVSFDMKEDTTWMGKKYLSDKHIVSSGVRFDLIILYNVLHEIGIDEWVKELKLILDLLSEDGVLLFGEREVLSVGERPYGKSGYLVLGKNELLKLFPGFEIQEILLPNKQATAAVCFAIKRKPGIKTGYPTETSVKRALRSLKESTKEEIQKRIRNGMGPRDNSRKYAFYCQQYVNVEEALEMLKSDSPNSKTQSGIFQNEPRASLNKDGVILTEILQSGLSPEEKQEQIDKLDLADIKEG